MTQSIGSAGLLVLIACCACDEAEAWQVDVIADGAPVFGDPMLVSQDGRVHLVVQNAITHEETHLVSGTIGGDWTSQSCGADPSDEVGEVSIAAAGGEMHVVWTLRSQDPPSGINYAMGPVGEGPWSDPIDLTVDLPDDVRGGGPRVAAEASGAVAIAWNGLDPGFAVAWVENGVRLSTIDLVPVADDPDAHCTVSDALFDSQGRLLVLTWCGKTVIDDVSDTVGEVTVGVFLARREDSEWRVEQIPLGKRPQFAIGPDDTVYATGVATTSCGDDVCARGEVIFARGEIGAWDASVGLGYTVGNTAPVAVDRRGSLYVTYDGDSGGDDECAQAACLAVSDDGVSFAAPHTVPPASGDQASGRPFAMSGADSDAGVVIGTCEDGDCDPFALARFSP